MADLDIVSIGELHVVPDTGRPKSGAGQSETGMLRDAWVRIRDGRIDSIGSMAEFEPTGRIRALDAQGGTVFPGLVESHAHPVFAGNRSHEYAARVGGRPASIITSDEDSGIKFTVTETRKAGDDELRQHLLEYLHDASRWGVTTCEAKGGYGLSLEEELRHLRVMESAVESAPVHLVRTFGGGHDVPFGRFADEYVDELVEIMLPEVASLPEVLSDITCEAGIFTPVQVQRVLAKAAELGIRSKVHADAFADSGGWSAAAEAGALSADHLTYTPVSELERHAGSDTVATVLPLAELVYMTPVRAPARAIIDNDIPLAVATDYCSSIGARSLYRAMITAAPWFGLTPEQALVGATLNGAYALGCAEQVGSLDVGKRGDVVVTGHGSLNDVFWNEPVPPRVIRGGVVLR